MLARQEPMALPPLDFAFGQLLRRFRLASGLSQEQLAEQAGLSVAAINTLERGTRRAPRADTIARLANALYLSLADRVRLESAVVRARHAAYIAKAAALPHASSLPVPLASFVGRDNELRTVRQLLGCTRLLTLTGAPGTGKTRLALAAAATLEGVFADGIVFVPLAPVADADLVLLTIAQALGLPDHTGQTVQERLHAALARRRLLLLLDNFEQVVTAAPHLAYLLLRCPGLTALVTSRSLLHTSGEQVYVVPPLRLPATGLRSSRHLAVVESVRLFAERARAVAPDFVLTDGEAGAVAEICRRLDGLPLAIELVAARVRLSLPSALLPALEQRLRLLTGGPGDMPERQQTLTSAIAWSYDLLTPDARQLFQRLAVFAGGFTAEAAEVVAPPSPMPILDRLATLLDASLLHRPGTAEGTSRFGILETLREFGLARLDADPERDVPCRRHAAHFLALVERGEPELRGPGQLPWFTALEQERDNLRAAHGWLAERGRGGDAEAAAHCLRLVGGQWWFWYVRGWWVEARRQIAQALALPAADAPTWARAKALHGLAVLTWAQDSDPAVATLFAESFQLFDLCGDQRGGGLVLFHRAMAGLPDDDRSPDALLEASLDRFRAASDRWGEALVICQTAFVAYWRHGDAVAAQRLFAESLALLRTLGERWGLLWALHAQGSALIGQGALDAAAPLLEESLALAQEIADQPQVARSLDLLAALAARRGDRARARSRCAEALRLHRQLGNRVGVAECLYQFADLAYARGHYRRARELYQRCLDCWRAMAAKSYMADAHIQLAFVALELGERSAATRHFQESLVLQSEPVAAAHLAWVLEGYARLALTAGEADRAWRLCGAATELRRKAARVAPLHEQHRLERWFGPAPQSASSDAAAAARAEGQVMTPEQALAYALAGDTGADC